MNKKLFIIATSLISLAALHASEKESGAGAGSEEAPRVTRTPSPTSTELVPGKTDFGVVWREVLEP